MLSVGNSNHNIDDIIRYSLLGIGCASATINIVIVFI
jgi:hypothetical protein